MKGMKERKWVKWREKCKWSFIKKGENKEIFWKLVDVPKLNWEEGADALLEADNSQW